MQRSARILRFDQFLLDPGRQTILTGGQEIRLRPKAFNLLHYLAKHSGRLVTKQELHEAIWPTVVVSDDVLVQCIRELRRALADHKHRLIKTVSRRGYLLDSKPKARGKPPSADPREISPQIGASPIVQPLSVPLEFTPATLPASAVSKLFKESDAEQAAAIAKRKQLPMPAIQIGTPDDDVAADIRRFIGIWVSEKGFVNTNRQFMFAVTRVEKAGLAGGYTVRGPPATQQPPSDSCGSRSVHGAHFRWGPHLQQPERPLQSVVRPWRGTCVQADLRHRRHNHGRTRAHLDSGGC